MHTTGRRRRPPCQPPAIPRSTCRPETSTTTCSTPRHAVQGSRSRPPRCPGREPDGTVEPSVPGVTSDECGPSNTTRSVASSRVRGSRCRSRGAPGSPGSSSSDAAGCNSLDLRHPGVSNVFVASQPTVRVRHGPLARDRFVVRRRSRSTERLAPPSVVATGWTESEADVTRPPSPRPEPNGGPDRRRSDGQ